MVSYSKGFFGEPKLERVEGFSLAKNCTYGVGGRAKFAYLPKTATEAEIAFDLCKRANMSHVVLGKGSNILVSDNDFDGAVISTKNLCGIKRISEEKLFCFSGTSVSKILSYCKEQSLGGLEFLYGIPASVGGAAYMNAGVAEGRISDRIIGVNIYDGKRRYLTNSACNFMYKQSTMQNIDCIITSLILQVNKSSKEEIERIRAYFINKRKNLPKGRSCGCVFKNGESYSAAKLIEEAGLKGFTIGGATVSKQHANFIINCGATSSDIRRVIEHVKRTIKLKFSVDLLEEVVYIGDFNDINS